MLESRAGRSPPGQWGAIPALHPQGISPQQQLTLLCPHEVQGELPAPGLGICISLCLSVLSRALWVLFLLTVTVSPRRESGLGCSAPEIPGSASLTPARDGQKPPGLQLELYHPMEGKTGSGAGKGMQIPPSISPWASDGVMELLHSAKPERAAGTAHLGTAR